MAGENNPDNKQMLQKYGVFAGMFLAFGFCMWLIFAPSGKEKGEADKKAGFNDEVPSPYDDGLVGDKRSAYEMDRAQKKGEEGMMSLSGYSDILEAERAKKEEVPLVEAQPADTGENGLDGIGSPIQSSIHSYRDINRTLGSFQGDGSTDDREQELLALEWRIQELEKASGGKGEQQDPLDGQIRLMEKSYELAARYAPGLEAGANGAVAPGTAEAGSGGKVFIYPVSRAGDRVVSSLMQGYGAEDSTAAYGGTRNTGFFTPGDEGAAVDKNTIRACIHSDRTVMAGQSVPIRLLEPLSLMGREIPPGTVMAGNTSIQGERLAITVSSIQHEGSIYPVKIAVHDTDGMAGIYIPGSMEMDAFKEMAANMGSNMSSSINITDNAGSQIATDLTRGLIQGSSQLFAKKVRMVKVSVKAGHNVLLCPDNK